MQLSNWKKFSLGILATIVLGAIGSGFWELGLKPFAQWLARILLRVLTLGSNAIRDEIYREAAKGQHEMGALHLYWLALMVFIIPCSFFLGTISGRRSSRKLREELSALDISQKGVALDETLERLKSHLYRLQFVCLGLVLIVWSIEAVGYLEVAQANAACTFFEQSVTICRPYMDDQQTRTLQSQFASMNRREEFVNIVQELETIASSHQRKLPEFTPF